MVWLPVKSVEKTGVREDGYDLTVPGCETFMSADGVILSNTVNLHVPVSDKAVEQANDRMMPSKNLFSLTDLKSIRHSPQQEMALGLYMLTRNPTSKDPVRFKSAADAKKAYRRGEIGPNDPIIVGGA
jgi:hypothetical protein